MGYAGCTCPQADPKHGASYSVSGSDRIAAEPRATVVIPTIGRVNELRETLTRLLTVAGEFIDQIVVVGDGVQLERDRLPLDARIRVEHLPSAQGAAACRNFGAQWALTSHIVFLDDDVLVASEWASSLRRWMSTDMFCVTGPIVGRDESVLGRARQLRYDDRYDGIACSDPVAFLAGGNSVIPARLFREAGGFPTLKVGSDTAFVRAPGVDADSCRFCWQLGVLHRNDRGWRAAVLAAWLSGATDARACLRGPRWPRLAWTDPAASLTNLVLAIIKLLAWSTARRAHREELLGKGK